MGDGVYLRFGGKKYEDLDAHYFNTQFWLLVFFEIIVGIVITAAGAVLITDDENKKFIIAMIGVCCVLQLPRTLLQYLMQTTNRIVEYARTRSLKKRSMRQW